MIAGRYHLDREVGRGGMGAVWLGRDELLGREVALKRIGRVPGTTSPDLETPDLERAAREARLAARLNHPHVVAVYDLVEEGEDHWLVMEYVAGTTLAALVKRDGALSPTAAAPLLRQAADALTAAHAAGIVHRDVKPSNMLVTEAGQVKLSDFGIARAQADASLTQTGLVTGSPAYLSPEVASGSSATAASDVWALGATLFHALAGHPPYDVHGNLMGALYRIVHEEPPRLSDAGPLGPVLEHTMARDPADRWSMAQVREQLTRPVPASSATSVVRRPVVVGADVTEVGTQQLAPVAPTPPAPAAPEPPEERRRGRVWPWLVAVVALVAVAVVGVAALVGGGSGDPQAHVGGTRSPSTSPSSHSPSAAVVTKAAMKDFVVRYLRTVTADQQSTWRMLTPSFQQSSGPFAKYQAFWRQHDSAVPSDIVADPASMTVTYRVRYLLANGRTSHDDRTLQLVRAGSSFKIDDDTKA